MAQPTGEPGRPLEQFREYLNLLARMQIGAGLRGQFDTVMTDPPYTAAGAELFVSRAVSAFQPEPGKQLFRHLDDRNAFRSSAQQDGNEVRLIERVGAVGKQPFSWTFTEWKFFDEQATLHEHIMAFTVNR